MRKLLARLFLASVTSTAAAQALNIDINFGSGAGSGVPSSAFGAAAGQPGTWNSVSALGQSTGLVGLNGAATGVSMQISGSGVVHTVDDASATGDYAKLVEDGYKLPDGDVSFDITFWGLTPGVYAFYTYADDPADGAAHSLVRHGWGEFTVGGTHALNQFSAPATHGVHLARVADTLGFSVRSNPGLRGVLAGIQVVPVVGRLYVNDNAAAGGDGRSWTTATRDLAQVIEMVGEGTSAISEIWVAEGTYLPGDTQSAEFELPPGIELVGGFAGTETSVGQRNIAAHPTILSGELGASGFSDNCERIMRVSLCGSDTLIDGFTFSGAHNPIGLNGALYITDSQLTVRNCRFELNSGWEGAAIALDASSPRIENCTFVNNEAAFGAGIYVWANSSPAVVHCDFRSNHASGHGGAMAQNSSSAMSFTNCRFFDNDAEAGGGAISIFDGDAHLTNCVFTANSVANGPGGALEFDGYARAYLYQCTSALNHSNFAGGGLVSGIGTQVYIYNSIFYANTDGAASTDIEGAQLLRYDGGQITVTSSDVQGWSGSIPGAANFNANPLFVDIDGADNIAGTFDDNPRLAAGSPCIDRGSNESIPSDAADLDHDTNVLERIPFDLSGNARRVDDPNTVDGGAGSAPLVDVGAYEFGSTCELSGDTDADGDVDLQDLARLLAHFASGGASESDGDTDGDGDVDLQDVASLLSDFGTACP